MVASPKGTCQYYPINEFNETSELGETPEKAKFDRLVQLESGHSGAANARTAELRAIPYSFERPPPGRPAVHAGVRIESKISLNRSERQDRKDA
jgi:hypothetical protein